jgi:hypoxanthine-guanine phosphoribosyltransferase
MAIQITKFLNIQSVQRIALLKKKETRKTNLLKDISFLELGDTFLISTKIR